MVKKIWRWLAALGSICAVFFYALLEREKKLEAQAQAVREEEAREAEQLGVEAMIGGLNKETQKRDEIIDSIKRDHFT